MEMRGEGQSREGRPSTCFLGQETHLLGFARALISSLWRASLHQDSSKPSQCPGRLLLPRHRAASHPGSGPTFLPKGTARGSALAWRPSPERYPICLLQIRMTCRDGHSHLSQPWRPDRAVQWLVSWLPPSVRFRSLSPESLYLHTLRTLLVRRAYSASPVCI